jgi:hypothetical protein
MTGLGRLPPFATGRIRPKAAGQGIYQKVGDSLSATLSSNVKQATSKTRSFSEFLATGIFSWCEV